MTLALSAALSLSVAAFQASAWPKTQAELSGYAKTSSYPEVMRFLYDLEARNPPFRRTSLATSTGGKDIPLLIVHANPNITPAQARLQRKPVVYIQANIHAGEVEGKEAVLALLRDWTNNPKAELLRNLVLVVVPIYNTDGNDNWGPNKTNRPHQDGPDPVGRRENGQGLDLNRDCMKAATPEMQGVLSNVYNVWDPDVIMDLHTTNGTRHGYVMTYSPGLNPTCDKDVMSYTRDNLLMRIRKRMDRERGWKFFDYGNAETRNGKQVYASFGAEPRYVTNYASIRNRIGILTEAASFQPFQLRIETTYVFVKTILDELNRDRRKVVDLIQRANQRWMEIASSKPMPQLAVRYELESRGQEEVLLEINRKPEEIDPMKAPTEFRKVRMPILDRFKGSRFVTAPRGYLVLNRETRVLELLQRHGITSRPNPRGGWESIAPETIEVARNAFQGVRMVTLTVKPAGLFRGDQSGGEYTYFPLGQPLGLLAFHLLEPESPDGVVAWGMLTQTPEIDRPLPIIRVR